MGFGYTFNNEAFWKLHSPDNEYNRLFFDIMSPFDDESALRDGGTGATKKGSARFMHWEGFPLDLFRPRNCQ